MRDSNQDSVGLGRNDFQLLERKGNLFRDLLADVTRRHAEWTARVAGEMDDGLKRTAQALLVRVDPPAIAERGRAAVQDALRAANEALGISAMHGMPDQGQPVSQRVVTAVEPLSALIAELRGYLGKFDELGGRTGTSAS